MTGDLLSDPTVLERFERYFKHPEPAHELLQMGDSAVACKNARTVLNKWGYRSATVDDPHFFDQELAEAVKQFQRKHNIERSTGLSVPEPVPGLFPKFYGSMARPSLPNLMLRKQAESRPCSSVTHGPIVLALTSSINGCGTRIFG
jgi:hypothetical protein